MKIGISIRLFTPSSGGLQHHAAALAQHLRAQKHEVTIITRSFTHTPSFHDYFFHSEARTLPTADRDYVQILRHGRILNPAMWLVLKCTGRSRLRSFGIRIYNAVYTRKIHALLGGVDLIHHVGQGSEMIGFAAAAAARRMRVPFLVQPTVHPGQWGDTAVDIALYRQADRLLSHTIYEERWLRARNLRQPVDVVGNGIDDRADGDGARFRAQYGLQGPIVLFLGRKTGDKGYPLLREAFPLVRHNFPEASLVCAGPGGAALTPGGSQRDGVVELDYVDEATKHDALAACSVLCVPSEAESFGLVYMEAGRYMKPLVARRLPVLEELLGNEQAALLVGTPGDYGNRVDVTVKELAEALGRVLEDTALAKRLGANAHRVSTRFIWARVVPRFIAAYHLALARR